MATKRLHRYSIQTNHPASPQRQIYVDDKIEMLKLEYISTPSQHHFSLHSFDNIDLIIVIVGQLNLVHKNGDIVSFYTNEANFLYTTTDQYNINLVAEGTVAYIIRIAKQKFKSLIAQEEPSRTQFIHPQNDGFFWCSPCHKIIHPKIKILSADIDHFNADDAINQQLIYHKIFEITLYQLHQHVRPACGIGCSLKPYQVEKISEAKTIIEKKLNEPCSLLQISRAVGLNDCTLKKGFKEQYGTTVFGYLNDLRMQKAVDFLEQGETDMQHIADEVGYVNASNFMIAFKKKYGISPKQYLDNKAAKAPYAFDR